VTGRAVTVDGLVVRYGDVEAVRGITLDVPCGEITAVLGPNGAGKSSVLKTLCTLQTPTEGLVRVFGHDICAEPVKVRRELGVVFQEPTLDRELSVERNLVFHARLYGVPRRRIGERVTVLLERFGLRERRGELVEQLSGGLARRVEIARALLHQPGLLVLDEPTSGLDPESRRAVWNDLRRLRDEMGITVLYSTHYMDEAEFADRIVIIRDGRIVRAGSPVSLKAGLEASSVLLSTHDDLAAERNLVLAGFEVVPESGGLSVRTPEPEQAIAALVAGAGVPVVSVWVRHPSLDDVFLAATTEGAQ
jgi:ABC-2 type transport system ATP-binding protein